LEFERPTSEKCGWVGEPVPVLSDPQSQAYADNEVETPPKDKPKPEGDCVAPV
jgi:hypothetical protein